MLKKDSSLPSNMQLKVKIYGNASLGCEPLILSKLNIIKYVVSDNEE
jgi:hypothetical protein